MTKDEILALPRTRLIFKYMALDGKGKPYFVWMQEDGEVRHYAPKSRTNIVPALPGMIYDFPDDGNSIYHSLNYAEHVGEWPDQVAITIWAAEHRANMQLEKAAKDLSKLVKVDQLKRFIDPLRIAYLSLEPAQQSQLLAWFVREVTRE